MPSRLLLRNCRLYTAPDASPVSILIEGTTIRSIGGDPRDGTPFLDAGGRIAVPGFIEVHIQGAGGADVLDGTRDALSTMCAALARLGTTGFLGTSVVRPVDGNAHLRLMRENTGKDLGGANLLGIHLEGPFINPKKKGGLSPESIYASSPAALDAIYEATGDALKMMTIAPELPGNLEIIRRLVSRGTIAAFAHSEATYEETRRGFDAGITHVTHIFNAMSPLHHRSPGPVAAIFEHPSVSAQIISDGNHLHPAAVNLVWRNLGPGRCICITDGVQGMGLPDGRYFYNEREYESKEGAARYLDGTLIGTTMGLASVALRFKEFTGCTLADAIDTVTSTPAKLLGIGSAKGSLEIGKDADIVLLDADYSIFCTIVGGKVVFAKDGVHPIPSGPV